MVNPCTPTCEERSIMCHGTCEKYKTWKAEYDEQKRLENLGRIKYSFATEQYSFGKTHRRSRSHKK